MQRKTLLTALHRTVALLALLLAGAANADLVCDDPDDGIEPPLPTDLCIVPADAETPQLWLGLAATAVCPPVAPSQADNWTVEKLFNVGTGVPPGLARYCLYTYTGPNAAPGPPPTRLCTAGEPPCLEQLDADLLSMAYQGGTTQTVEGLVWEPLRDHFVEQAGGLPPLPGAPALVRLSVVDTEPSGMEQDRNGQGTSPHGYTLLAMARELICPPTGPCGVELRSGLGLPLLFCSDEPQTTCPCNGDPRTVCPDEANGGYVGTIGQLARAIRSEVVHWLQTGPQRLVINLSLGWDPSFGGLPNGNGPVAVQAVRSALEDARCRGALVFAAAGNRVSGPGTATGPLLPGGWEQLDAPDFFTCRDDLLEMANPPDSNDFPSGGGYFPLVYSTAAVRNDNEPVAQRPGGEPPLVAFGDHGVATIDPAGTPVPAATLSGSSVSTAVISAATAAAWYYRPTAPGYAVVQSVYNAGEWVGRTADYCQNGTACTNAVRRVTACTAVLGACTDLSGGGCPVASCQAPDPVLPAIPTDTLNAVFDFADVDVDLSTLGNSGEVAACRSGYTLHWSAGPIPDNPCPQQQFYGVQVTPWTDGQPSGQPCETCTGLFQSPGKVFLEVKSGFVGSLTDITLLCGDDAYRVDASLTEGKTMRFREIPEQCEFTEVAVSYRVDTGGGSPASVVSPVLLVLDRDDDGIQDGEDNCITVINADQRDTNGDAIGNVCDPDIADPENAVGECLVNFADLAAFKAAFNTDPGEPEYNPDADFDGDGFINFGDLVLIKQYFLQPPGPSALGCN